MNPNTDSDERVRQPQMDWQQVALNGGPPCFFVEGPQFCGRAERWQGHGNKAFHDYISLDDLLTTARQDARDAAFKESAEFFCHWLLRTYEAIHRDTSYEEGENLDSIAREINQVIGFAGYKPESTARTRLLTKQFAWNGFNRAEGDGDG